MRILVLGASGMLGHKLCLRLALQHTVVGTVRGPASRWSPSPVLGGVELLERVDADRFDSVVAALATVQPNVVINCVGLVKQSPIAKNPVTAISINALFPHRLAELCRAAGSRLVHFSTDCVFAGNRGSYTEADAPDPTDLYGRTKLLGEVAGPGCVTLRCSILGRELRGRRSLVEWFLAQRGGAVRGFTGAIYTGLTTLVMAELVERLIGEWTEIEGLWQVASEPINKFELLTLINRVFDLDVDVEPDSEFQCDRSLDGSRFAAATGFSAPTWETMVKALRNDVTAYA